MLIIVSKCWKWENNWYESVNYGITVLVWTALTSGELNVEKESKISYCLQSGDKYLLVSVKLIS